MEPCTFYMRIASTARPARCSPWPRRVRRTACSGGLDASSAPRRPLDPVRRLRQARRGGARGRCRRRRLDPRRRHGRALRAEYLDRPGRSEGAAPAQQEGVRRPPDDRALRPLSRSLRQGRLRHYHRACRGRLPHSPLAAGDPCARQESRRNAQSRDAGRDHRAGDRLEKISRLRALAGARPVDIEIDGGVTPEIAPAVAQAGANVLVAGSAVFKGGKPESYRANIAAIRNAAALARGEAA
jgi:hypothetical protein